MEQNKELLYHFLNRTFFRDWKDKDKESDRTKLYDNLEFQINSKCNLNCSYCYYNQFVGNGNQLNPNSIAQPENIRKNADALLDYLEENNMYPSKFEIFSGEPLNQPITYEVLDKVIDFYSRANQEAIISIPTNMSFLRSDRLTEKVISYKKKAWENGLMLGTSASVDGKYMDHVNRPITKSENQDKFFNDHFYHRLFSFARDHGCGFHPMVYHNNIEQWKDNFMWFQDNFKKYGLRWNNIYLLEVRNDGWTKDKVNSYMDFYKFVLEFAFNKLNRDKNEFVNGFVFNGKGASQNWNNMNLFNNIGKIGRGIGCSIQTTMQIRAGDLTVNPCHRQSYDALNGFQFVKNDDNKIVDIKPLNLPYYLTIMSSERKYWPYCESCLIGHTCMAGCLGSQFEVMGDPFIPIPSVCLLEFGKVKSQVQFFVKNDMFDQFISKLPEEQKNVFTKIYELLYSK